MRRRALQSGTTLLEMLVSIAFFAIISSALFMLFAGTSRQFSYTTKTVGLQTDLAGALNVFLDDVSLTGFAGYTSGAYTTLATASSVGGGDTRTVLPPATALPSVTLNGGTSGNPPDSIQFIADISSSTGAPDGAPDRVTYQVSGGNLTRTIELGDGSGGYTGGTISDTLASKVTGFRLRLYDSAHTTPLTAANVANTCYIQATVFTADTTVKGGIPLAKSLSGESVLRNFLSLNSCSV